MLVRVTYGYVVQTFDPKSRCWIDQEFIADGDVEWETLKGKSVDAPDNVPEISFDMKQPSEIDERG